jgi:hypothetical protein
MYRIFYVWSALIVYRLHFSAFTYSVDHSNYFYGFEEQTNWVCYLYGAAQCTLYWTPFGRAPVNLVGCCLGQSRSTTFLLFQFREYSSFFCAPTIFFCILHEEASVFIPKKGDTLSAKWGKLLKKCVWNHMGTSAPLTNREREVADSIVGPLYDCASVHLSSILFCAEPLKQHNSTAQTRYVPIYVRKI